MSKGEGIYPDVGRQAPTGGAHIFLGQENIFFVTVCTKDKADWLANSTVQTSLLDIWQKEATAWLVGYYLLMPDHLHLFCAPRDLHFNIDTWIMYWKALFRRQHLAQPWEWQRRAFHHRMRNQPEYVDKLTYARENPIRKNLVKDMDEWPYQGFAHNLGWTSSK